MMSSPCFGLFLTCFMLPAMKPDPIIFNICKNGGTRAPFKPEDWENGKWVPKMCDCTAEWEGFLCDKRKCVHGTIKNDSCLCNNYYNGSTCERLISCAHGNLTEPGVCQCEIGWYGVRCHLLNCHNGRYMYQLERCHCYKDYSGPTCDSYIGPTTLKPIYRPKPSSEQPLESDSNSPWTQHPAFIGALALFGIVALICMFRLCTRSSESSGELPARYQQFTSVVRWPIVRAERAEASIRPQRTHKTAVVKTENQEDMPPSYGEAMIGFS